METIPEEDYLQISGLQHYRFCPRQWALIYLEQQWAENERTVDGFLFHTTAHDEEKIENACQDARLLASPRGIWQIYDYNCDRQEVCADPPFIIQGKKIGAHLAGCDKVILLSATVGEEIEETVTRLFAEGEYTASVLLDAAATTAVEQIADDMEKVIRPKAAAQGYGMRWRFSPGDGDWPIDQQPEMIRLASAGEIGVSLSSSMMLIIMYNVCTIAVW